jgi:predicted dehydrogenase
VTRITEQRSLPHLEWGKGMAKKVRAGILGYGRMGRGFVAAMQQNELWEVSAVYDINPAARQLARRNVPSAAIHEAPDPVFADPHIDVVGLFTLADARPQQIRQALAAGKHVLAEKPLAADVGTEWQLVREIEASDRFVAVNLFNRNAWYHKNIQRFIADGQIGDLAVIRICHMTPGHMPMEGHDPEGPPFHDCGMHYVDVARWYANSEYKNWHAQGIRMWDYKDPWWVQVHGTFENGIVYDITQGFIYGHLAKQQPHNCYVDAIGTKGVARMRHDFSTATVELYGVAETLHKTAPFNDKKLDVMVDVLGRSVLQGTNLGFPRGRDSVIASEVSWAMLNDAIAHQPPVRGTPGEMQQILEHRRNLVQGFGLPVKTVELLDGSLVSS